MYAIGHLALAYLTGKACAKGFKVELNLPLLLTMSILPDVDLVLSLSMGHRSVTHSIFTMTLIVLPFLLKYKKAALPYFFALLSHSLIGDFVTGGSEIFWPFTSQSYGMFNFSMNGIANASLELVLFGASLTIMIRSKDFGKLIRLRGIWNWVLVAPFLAVLLPVVQLGFSWFKLEYLDLPLSPILVFPSLFWIIIMGYILAGFVGIRKRGQTA